MPSIITKLHPYSLFATHLESRFGDIRLSAGTGLCVSRAGRTYLATARHNFTGRHATTNQPLSPTAAIPDKISAWFHHQDFSREAWTELEFRILDDEGHPLWLAHLNRSIDLAVLPFSPRSALVPSLNLDGYTGLPQIAPGKHIHLIGFPLGRASHGHIPIWNTGALATELMIDFNALPMFLVDCTARPGNSGSPVFVETGYTATAQAFGTERTFPELAVLGIYTGRLDERSDIGMAWKLPAVVEIIETNIRDTVDEA